MTPPRSSVDDDDDDPFEGILDEEAARPGDVRAHYLRRARREYAEIQRDWIQLPRDKGQPARQRGSLLAELVTNRRGTALECFLLLHALQPMLQRDFSLPMSVWATMLSGGRTVSETTASKAFGALEDMQLVSRTRRGNRSLIEPLAENGSGDPWVRPGARDSAGQGYFVLPFAYWLDGYSEELGLAGKAMLLIVLSETQIKPSTVVPIERAKDWYGISERTAERGYDQLDKAGLLRTHRQKRANPEVKGGFYHEYHRALEAPFSMKGRNRLQDAARAAGAARRRSAASGGDLGSATTPLDLPAAKSPIST